MRLKRILSKRIHKESEGISIAGGVNAVVSANVDERGTRTETSARQRVKVSAGRASSETRNPDPTKKEEA